MAIPEYGLRVWKDSDNVNLAKYANNIKIFNNMRDLFPHPYTLEDANKFIALANSQSPTKIFAITWDDEAIGSVGVFPKEDISRLNAEVGYWIAEPFWGRGLATQAMADIIDYGFQTFQLKRIFAIPFPHNLASKRVLEKNGLVLEAVIKDSLIKNNTMMDELIYSIREEDWKKLITSQDSKQR